jgi:hypothetical protein
MKDFESKLKNLRLRQPLQGLDERILAAKSAPTPANMRRGVRQISLWAAIAAALSAGLLGFAAGLAFRGNPTVTISSRLPPASVQVIHHAPSTGDPFDFTRNPEDILPHQVKVTFQILKGSGT